jgi:hypothetical protein
MPTAIELTGRVELWSACVEAFEVRICAGVEFDNNGSKVIVYGSVAGRRGEFEVLNESEFELNVGPVLLVFKIENVKSGPVCFDLTVSGCVEVLGFKRCRDLFKQNFCLPEGEGLVVLSSANPTLQELQAFSSLQGRIQTQSPVWTDAR